MFDLFIILNNNTVNSMDYEPKKTVFYFEIEK
jgi:hypothetical protein